jgi:hypothetical protein
MLMRLEAGQDPLRRVIEDGEHQLVLGREVVVQRTGRDPRALGDESGRRAAEPDGVQELDGGADQHRAGLGATIDLRPPGNPHRTDLPTLSYVPVSM